MIFILFQPLYPTLRTIERRHGLKTAFTSYNVNFRKNSLKKTKSRKIGEKHKSSGFISFKTTNLLPPFSAHSR